MRYYVLLTLFASVYYAGIAADPDGAIPRGRNDIMTAFGRHDVTMPLRGIGDIARGDRETVEQYLIDFGYLDSSAYNNYDLRRALRQFQRENNLTPVHGRITPEIITLINHKKEVQTVIDYLKKYNYIQDYDRRYQIPNAVKWLQRNSGELSVNGVIDPATINFVKNHQRGFAEPITETT